MIRVLHMGAMVAALTMTSITYREVSPPRSAGDADRRSIKEEGKGAPATVEAPRERQRRLEDVNTTDLRGAIQLGCETMQNVFNADDHQVPFFGSNVYPGEASFSFSAYHSEAHVPGRHLNALLNAEDAAGITLNPAAVENHRRAAFLSYSGVVPLPLNRSSIGGPLVNFCPHNLREGLHALYALVKYRHDAKARDLAIAASRPSWTCGNRIPGGMRRRCGRWG